MVESKTPTSVDLVEAIRKATLGAKRELKSELVEVEDFDIEVRQLTFGQRSEVNSKVLDGEGNFDNGKYALNMLVACCFDAKSGKQIYEDTDIEALSNMPDSGFVDVLARTAMRMNTVDVEEAEKN